MYVQYAKGSIWNSTELADKAISAPNRQGFPQKDVEGNLTLLIRESKTSFWHKQLLWSPPKRHVNRKSKRLACEKNMDWWPASTKPILERYAKDDRSTIALTEERLQMAWAPRFLNGDVAQMVERSLIMREVRGSMPRISNFSEEPEIKKGNTVSCFVRPKENTDFYVQYAKGSIWNSTELDEKAISAPNRQGVPQKRRRRKHYITDKRVKDIRMK